MNADEKGIEALYAAWRDAFRRQDVDAIFDLLTEDYALFAPVAPPQRADDLRPRLEAGLVAFEIDIDFEREERILSGDMAFERGWDVQTARPRDGGETRLQRQYVFLILRRGDDGVWRFARGMSLPTVSTLT